MKGMATCNICGRDFPLIIEEHYIVRDKKKTPGSLASVLVGEEPMEYDAFDCPHCGCQYIAQERKRFASIIDDIDDIENLCDMDECEDNEKCNEEEK